MAKSGGPVSRSKQELDVLAVGAHPDDVEIGCGGSLIRMSRAGHRVGVVDLTRAELSTRGNPRTRQAETDAASSILGLTQRFQLGFKEAEIAGNDEYLRKMVRTIRSTRPRLMITHWWEARHPDHRDAAELTARAVFWAGVKNFDPGLEPHRPHRVLHYFLHKVEQTSFIADISPVFEVKMAAIRAYKSQFGKKEDSEPPTFISRPQFLDTVVSRAQYFGSLIGAAYGEPFYVRDVLRVDDLLAWTDSQGVTG